MGRTVINKTELLTVGDLRRFLNSAECMAMNENAFVWVPNDATEAWNIDCAVEVSIDKVSTPEDGYPEEQGLCITAKRIRNKP